jgi:hypothetical protein
VQLVQGAYMSNHAQRRVQANQEQDLLSDNHDDVKVVLKNTGLFCCLWAFG